MKNSIPLAFESRAAARAYRNKYYTNSRIKQSDNLSPYENPSKSINFYNRFFIGKEVSKSVFR